ncbi:Arc family DNA-binding protein [Acinetobacter johnsonii]|jgi:hypothetical protein|uniref:Arc family DNA-binding protein n=1 Tax=Acinetobacter johnsonii TaxID=40214 RepID=UPI0007B4147E|nr:Arc family DNA-binding protein [Acinetobacter johnsonii]
MSVSSGNLTTQYNLRWSEDLKEKVVDASKENSRSINQEIVARLEQSFLVEDKPAYVNKMDVCLQIFSHLDYELEENEYQSLILQFEPGQIPIKGDVLEIETMEGSSRQFEVTKRIINTTTNGYVSATLEMRSYTEWDSDID